MFAGRPSITGSSTYVQMQTVAPLTRVAPLLTVTRDMTAGAGEAGATAGAAGFVATDAVDRWFAS